MNKSCIVTGGAGFIGCALSEELAGRYDRLVVVDMMHPQIHPSQARPGLLSLRAELIVRDVCEDATWEELLHNLEGTFDIVHLAAETGTAQSLCEATRHAMTNVVGTSRMLDALARHRKFPGQILLTSSRAVYGEGAWRRQDGSVFYPGQRTDAQLRAGEWDFPDARYIPFRADETRPNPTSVYGSTKLAQEHILSAWSKAFSVPLKILRLQNVYGPGQSLINPYTGIVSLFVRMAKRGESIPLYEDGEILRDFVLIDDVAQAIVLALESADAAGNIYDIGTGRATTIREIAEVIAARYDAPAPYVCGKYRNGDVRHASCDISAARATLHYEPQYTLSQGVESLCGWIDAQISH